MLTPHRPEKMAVRIPKITVMINMDSAALEALLMSSVTTDFGPAAMKQANQAVNRLATQYRTRKAGKRTRVLASEMPSRLRQANVERNARAMVWVQCIRIDEPGVSGDGSRGKHGRDNSRVTR